jgi:hypothetical protein
MRIVKTWIARDDFDNDIGIAYEFSDGHRWAFSLGHRFVGAHPNLIRIEAKKALAEHVKKWRGRGYSD